MRALGRAHTWSPLALAPTPARAPRVLLVDTTRHLTRMRLAEAGPAAVVTQTGATMEELLGFLERADLGLTAYPAPGDITIGGVLAIGGHGTAVPARGEQGERFGSVSNLVLSLTAVVWSERRGRYALRTFDRDDPACAALLTHLGRTLVTSVTLRAGPLRHLRCVSRTDVPAAELFAAPGSPGRTFAGFLEESGRVEAIWYPFTGAPWLKVWSVSPRRPASSRLVRAPYNYPFADTLSDAEQRAIRGRILADPSEAVALGQESYADTVASLGAERSADLWGASKDVLLYVRPATLRVTANGYAILTRRRDVQRVISEFARHYTSVVSRYRAEGLLSAQHAGRDPGHRARRSPRPRRRRRPARAALGARSARRPPGVGRRRLARHPVVPRHAGGRPRLPGHRALGVRQLPPSVRPGASRVVQGLGVHRARRVDEPQDHRAHRARRVQRLERRGPHPGPARPARRLHEPAAAGAAAHAVTVATSAARNEPAARLVDRT